MFDRRLKIVLIVLAAALLVIVARLVDLQVLHAGDYRTQADAVLLRPAQPLPFVRGRILDRFGAVLAADQPCWQVAVDYDAIVEEARREPVRTVPPLWIRLSAFRGESMDVLHQRARDIAARVENWADRVSAAAGYPVPIREQRMPHPILTALDDQMQVAARERFAATPSAHVTDGTVRVYHSSPSLPHIVGQLGAVGPDDLMNDPASDDPLSRYEPIESRGVSGVEYAAERLLRGRRGRIQQSRNGRTMEDIKPLSGRDVTLTIRMDLQERLYELLDERIPQLCPHPAGGSVVVLDVESREILALVSYPGYDANLFRRLYSDLRNDVRFEPLRFRPVANVYHPGSIVKPMTCLAGLASGVINTESTFHCDGYYLENVRDRYRCWESTVTGQRKAHGDVTATSALRGSCNIFMYHLGDAVGVERLCRSFEWAGLGHLAGTGLREERFGINPTPEWLALYRQAPLSPGDARNYAIGQGELVVSPLQAANLFAVYASGIWKPTQLIRGLGEPRALRLPIHADAWRAVREGMFQVTNDTEGTAYVTAHWANERFALCGKTGSATTPPKPTHYRIDYRNANGNSQSVALPAALKRDAVDAFRERFPSAEFDAEKDVVVESLFPPAGTQSDEKYAHAWFGGYLQRLDTSGRPDWNTPPRFAFVVLVEFGGSGGHVSGPIARDIAQMLFDLLLGELATQTVNGGQPS
ncbi:MAG: hypothetical protein HOP29_13470 [Phycisphaerales bacterium]|nr:hypothetical protein [Phycisphaerales bacterium]